LVGVHRTALRRLSEPYGTSVAICGRLVGRTPSTPKETDTVGSRVQLRELTRRGPKSVETAMNVDVDVNDEDGCLEVLRRMAKQKGLKPGDCELMVKTGRHSKTYRVG
jgi:hypothetical protein